MLLIDICVHLKTLIFVLAVNLFSQLNSSNKIDLNYFWNNNHADLPIIRTPTFMCHFIWIVKVLGKKIRFRRNIIDQYQKKCSKTTNITIIIPHIYTHRIGVYININILWASFSFFNLVHTLSKLYPNKPYYVAAALTRVCLCMLYILYSSVTV